MASRRLLFPGFLRTRKVLFIFFRRGRREGSPYLLPLTKEGGLFLEGGKGEDRERSKEKREEG
jgi:hypothetical protein